MGREMTKERSIIFGHKNIFVLEGVQVIGVFSLIWPYSMLSQTSTRPINHVLNPGLESGDWRLSIYKLLRTALLPDYVKLTVCMMTYWHIIFLALSDKHALPLFNMVWMLFVIYWSSTWLWTNVSRLSDIGTSGLNWCPHTLHSGDFGAEDVNPYHHQISRGSLFGGQPFEP